MIDTAKKRRDAIKKLIKTHAIENQDALVDLLKKKYSIATNQSIVSRDLHEMGVSKQKYKNKMIYQLQETDPNKEILQRGIVSIEHNEMLVVITVLPGLAGFVSECIDTQVESLGVLGTLAGENTIFVAPKNVRTIADMYKKVCLFLYFKKTEESL